MTPREQFERPVRLSDGRTVGSWSEEWRLECCSRASTRKAPPAPTEGELLGAARRGVRKGAGTERFFDDENEEDIIGATGELAFAKMFGLEVDRSLRPLGDNGVDFSVAIDGSVTTVDVKTYRKPWNLLVKTTEVARCADVLVLARFHADKSVSFLGWQTRVVMLSCPLKDFGYGIVNHYLPASKMRPMSELAALVGPLKGA